MKKSKFEDKAKEIFEEVVSDKKSKNQSPSDQILTITSIGDTVNDYNQLIVDTECELEELVTLLDPVLLNPPEKLTLTPLTVINASGIALQLLELNKRLQRIRSTLYNIKINVGI